MDAQSAKSLFARAQEHFAARRFEVAIIQIEEILEHFPDDKNILFAEARCLAALGKLEDSRALCRVLIDRHDHVRARQLLESLEQSDGQVGVNALPEGFLDFDRPPPPPLLRQSRARFTRRMVVRLLVLGAVGVGLVLGGLYARHRLMPATRWETNANDLVALNRKQSVPRVDHLLPSERERLTQLTTRPGQRIPARYWFADERGIPDWQPGIYRNVPCIDVPQRTLDIYIPMAYRDRPDALFPGLVMSSPGNGHGFWQLENWAERNEVILIWLNSSSNQTYSQNRIAQDVGLATAVATLRVDQSMGFAIGMSGGAAASWEMICRYPDGFQGVVMIAFGDSHNNCWIPSHVRVGYINGSQDFNADNIERTKPKLLARGNEVRHSKFVGGHELGALKLREKMLSWMVNEERRERRIPIPRRAQ